MFDKNKKKQEQLEQAAANQILTHMTTHGPGYPEFDTALRQLDQLTEVRNASKKASRFSPDAILGTVTTLGAVLVVVIHEERHVISQTATKFFRIVK